MELGEYERAQALFSESLALHRHVGDRQGIASTLNNLAEAASSLGDAETAMGLFRESHSLALEGGNRLYAAIAMENLAALTRLQGEDRRCPIAVPRGAAPLSLRRRQAGDRQLPGWSGGRGGRSGPGGGSRGASGSGVQDLRHA